MERKNRIPLLPCPFCGGEARLFVHSEGGVSVFCRKCLVSTKVLIDSPDFSFAVEDVIDIWNKRVVEEKP